MLWLARAFSFGLENDEDIKALPYNSNMDEKRIIVNATGTEFYEKAYGIFGYKLSGVAPVDHEKVALAFQREEKDSSLDEFENEFDSARSQRNEWYEELEKLKFDFSWLRVFGISALFLAVSLILVFIAMFNHLGWDEGIKLYIPAICIGGVSIIGFIVSIILYKVKINRSAYKDAYEKKIAEANERMKIALAKACKTKGINELM